ncbi:MAG: AcrR family transcriptional regulator [Myxococcota bacterium]|jgi:AcrR family transcriptional regulator
MSRRETILEAAEALFSHYGPAKTTISDIAKRSCVAVGAVYLEFRSKDQLLEAIASKAYANIIVAMQSAAELPRPYPERLTAVFEARVVAIRGHCSLGKHASDLLHARYSAIHQAKQCYREQQRDLLSTLLADGKRAGELSFDDPDGAAESLLLAYMAFEPPWVFGFDASQLVPTLQKLHVIVLRGLEHRSP